MAEHREYSWGAGSSQASQEWYIKIEVIMLATELLGRMIPACLSPDIVSSSPHPGTVQGNDCAAR